MANSLTFGSGGAGYQFPGYQMLDLTGELTLASAGYYSFGIERNGGDFVSNSHWIGYNNVVHYPGTLFAYTPGSAGVGFHATVPNSATCGQTETVTIRVFSAGGQQVCRFSGYRIKTFLPSVKGPALICPGASASYSLANVLTSALPYTWSLSNPAWHLNTASGPAVYSAMAASLAVYSPAASSASKLTVSGGSLCHPVSIDLVNHLEPPVFSAHESPLQQKNSVAWAVVPVAGAAGYEWSFTRLSGTGSIVLQPSGSGCEISAGAGTQGQFRIKVCATSSLCGVGPEAWRSLKVVPWVHP